MPAPEVIAPKEIDIQVPAGCDWNLEFQLTDADGDIVDISADTIAFSVFRKRTDVTPLIEMENAPGQHSTPLEGETTFALVPADTGWMGDDGQALVKYELWRVYDSGSKQSLWIKGSILFTAVRGR